MLVPETQNWLQTKGKTNQLVSLSLVEMQNLTDLMEIKVNDFKHFSISSPEKIL